MAMIKRTTGSPCCSCCGDAIFTDGFDGDLSAWTEVSGDWALGTGTPAHYVYTEDSDAVLLLTAEGPAAQRVRARMYFGSSPANSQGKIIMKWKDANNYLYALIESPGSTGYVVVTLHELISGVDAKIADGSAVTSSGGTGYYEACYINGTFLLRCNVGQVSFAKGTVSAPASLGNKVGLGTGTVDSGKSVRFDTYFSLRPLTIHCPNCFCDRCLPGTALTALKLTITGSTDPAWNADWTVPFKPSWDHPSNDEQSDCLYRLDSGLPPNGGLLWASLGYGIPVVDGPYGVAIDILAQDAFGTAAWYVYLDQDPTCQQVDCAAIVNNLQGIMTGASGIFSSAEVTITGVSE